jgi:hopanoid biosynthesis associated radical SAM protein HpnJ
MMKTLFLSPPNFEGFDGGAGSRYQCTREVRSFWYPTWLAQLAALVPGSKLIDGPARGLTPEDVLVHANDYELLILYTSTPSFATDVRVAEAFKDRNPNLTVGFCGAHVAVNPAPSLDASSAIDFVCRNEFDFTVKEVAEGKPIAEVDGLSYRSNGRIVHNMERALIADMNVLPWVTPIYQRDLVIEDYFNGYLMHPYLSIYTGRGCKSRCTFCLWPQTIGGHRYRKRSVENIAAEMHFARDTFPQVKEFFFDDDTLTDDIEHVEAVAHEMGKLGITWSCNAKANVPYDTLKVLKDNGLRLFLVGYESGSQTVLNNIKKGIRTDVARRFTQDCHDLGIDIHGTFIVGLPGETHETIEQTIRYAKELDPRTIQVSLPAAYPGTFLHRQAVENGWLLDDESLVGNDGVQHSVLEYPHLPAADIHAAVDTFYKQFYFRPGKMSRLTLDMLKDKDVMKRQLREGKEFFKFLFSRDQAA